MYAVVCRRCEVQVLVTKRIDDPQLAVMVSHLRVRHPNAVLQPTCDEFTTVIRHFRLRDGRRHGFGRLTRRPDAARGALVRAAKEWGSVTVLVGGRLAAQWLAATLPSPSTSPGKD